MSRSKKQALIAVLVAVAVLSLANIACDDEVVDAGQQVQREVDNAVTTVEEMAEDLPRFGDGMKIGEKLEKTTCEATGGKWIDSINVCK